MSNTYLDVIDELDWLEDEVGCTLIIMNDESYRDYTDNRHEVMFHMMGEHISRIKIMVREIKPPEVNDEGKSNDL